MSENKTKPTDSPISAYLDAILDTKQNADAHRLYSIMVETTGENGKMWGSSIVGFGSYHYKYESGREGDSPKVAFSARKQAIVVYGLSVQDDKNTKLLSEIGKIKLGKGCVYIKQLSDINLDTLKSLVSNAYTNKHEN